jgi:hypothetical protein
VKVLSCFHSAQCSKRKAFSLGVEGSVYFSWKMADRMSIFLEEMRKGSLRVIDSCSEMLSLRCAHTFVR